MFMLIVGFSCRAIGVFMWFRVRCSGYDTGFLEFCRILPGAVGFLNNYGRDSVCCALLMPLQSVTAVSFGASLRSHSAVRV